MRAAGAEGRAMRQGLVEPIGRPRADARSSLPSFTLPVIAPPEDLAVDQRPPKGAPSGSETEAIWAMLVNKTRPRSGAAPDRVEAYCGRGPSMSRKLGRSRAARRIAEKG
jgi:hypothetical protein